MREAAKRHTGGEVDGVSQRKEGCQGESQIWEEPEYLFKEIGLCLALRAMVEGRGQRRTICILGG